MSGWRRVNCTIEPVQLVAEGHASRPSTSRQSVSKKQQAIKRHIVGESVRPADAETQSGNSITLTVDHSARGSMKDAASCEKWCVAKYIDRRQSERALRLRYENTRPRPPQGLSKPFPKVVKRETKARRAPAILPRPARNEISARASTANVKAASAVSRLGAATQSVSAASGKDQRDLRSGGTTRRI